MKKNGCARSSARTPLAAPADDDTIDQALELDEAFFARAEFQSEHGLVPIWLAVEPEVADWFLARGARGANEAADTLRDYVQRQKGAP